MKTTPPGGNGWLVLAAVLFFGMLALLYVVTKLHR